MNKPFFITTPIYYANGSPHLGHAYTTIAADCLARYHALSGEAFLATGMDEHGAKIERKAEEEGKEPQAFVDGIAEEFQLLWKELDIRYTRFIRTTEPAHKAAVEKVLQTLYEQGAIYKGEYEGLYCVGCEQFKMRSDLVDGKCPDHGTIPELMREESYLLKMSEKQAELIAKIEANDFEIRPEKYKAEILSFLRGGTLHDISISRKNVAWGVPLPFDPAHTTYVWADAFLNYLTVLGWDGDTASVPEAWPADAHLIGKDILRVHATIWPVMLLHLGIPLPRMLFTHGHILSGGKKMSKTLGNVIAIGEMLERFGADGTRYLLLAAGAFGEDVDVTLERMTEKYNADLANGLGNLVSRVLKLAEQLETRPAFGATGPLAAAPFLERYDLSGALSAVWSQVRTANKYMDDEKPWALVKEDREKFRKVMEKLLGKLGEIARELEPLLPGTSQKIAAALKAGKLETALFQRIG